MSLAKPDSGILNWWVTICITVHILNAFQSTQTNKKSIPPQKKQTSKQRKIKTHQKKPPTPEHQNSSELFVLQFSLLSRQPNHRSLLVHLTLWLLNYQYSAQPLNYFLLSQNLLCIFTQLFSTHSYLLLHILYVSVSELSFCVVAFSTKESSVFIEFGDSFLPIFPEQWVDLY